MTTAIPSSLAFQIGARTLFKIRRRLVRVALSLDEVLAGRVPALPPLALDRDDVPLAPSALRRRWRQAEQLWSNLIEERAA